MKLVLVDKNKKDLFIALFQSLKYCTNTVCITFNTNKVFIQGMDKSHVCMFEASISSSWFNEYSSNSHTISFDSQVFYNIISTKHDAHSLEMNYQEEADTLCINLIAPKGEFNKFFKIPLVEFEYEIMSVPTVDYDAEFSISSKKIFEITSQMLSFGDNINIKCSDEQIGLITNGISGEMLVTIQIDDLTEYSINEGESLELAYSLSYVHKMCLTNKLSNEIQFSLSKEYPMKLKYDLGETSTLEFYIAPKILE
jgi:proliferating cell nuclear antigen PCNA